MLIKKFIALITFFLAFDATYVFASSKIVSTSEFKNITVEFTQDTLSGWSDLPPGVYRVPDSQVIVAGFKKSGAPGLLFGGIGVLVQGAFNSSAARKSIDGVHSENLELSLVTEAQAIADAKILSGKYGNSFASKKEERNPVLKIVSAVVITFSSDTEARPSVIFKASLTVPNEKKPIWSNAYIASLGQTMPFDGSPSLMDANGAELKRLIALDLERVTKLMLDDVSNPIVRAEENLISVEGAFIYLRQPLQVSAYKLAEDNDTLTFSPNMPFGASSIVGVSIVDKSAVIQAPLKKGEQFIKEAPKKKK